MAGRKLRDEADARACLAAMEASGLSLSEWARQHGMDGRSLHCWRMSLARRSSSPPPVPDRADVQRQSPVRMVELVAAPSQTHHGTVQAAAPRYLIRCGPFALEFDDPADQSQLARILEVMALC